jgi:hypothetical protein
MEALFLKPISEASWPNARFLLRGLERPNTPMPDRVFADSRPKQSATVYRAAPLAADRRSRQLKQFHRGTLTLAHDRFPREVRPSFVTGPECNSLRDSLSYRNI